MGADRRTAAPPWVRAMLTIPLLLLALVGYLERRANHQSPQPHRYTTLRGTTQQGVPITVTLRGGRITELRTEIHGTCRGGSPYTIRWTPSTSQGNVGYQQRARGHFFIREWPDKRYPHPPEGATNAYMEGQLDAAAERVSGYVAYTTTTGDNACRSGRVAFSAQSG
jgi:hypothetical protein